jgi:hypothetical protein
MGHGPRAISGPFLVLFSNLSKKTDQILSDLFMVGSKDFTKLESMPVTTPKASAI